MLLFGMISLVAITLTFWACDCLDVTTLVFIPRNRLMLPKETELWLTAQTAEKRQQNQTNN
jgi:hypothetical protein